MTKFFALIIILFGLLVLVLTIVSLKVAIKEKSTTGYVMAAIGFAMVIGCGFLTKSCADTNKAWDRDNDKWKQEFWEKEKQKEVIRENVVNGYVTGNPNSSKE